MPKILMLDQNILKLMYCVRQNTPRPYQTLALKAYLVQDLPNRDRSTHGHESQSVQPS